MTVAEFKFRGFIAPVFTPYNNDSALTVNLAIIEGYAQHLADNGVNGVLVGGTSGEGTSLSLVERKQISEEWSKAVKETKQHLMIQVGGAPLPDVLELARHAESVNADSLLCLPELYFKPSCAQDLIDYLKIVSNAAPKTPLLYYHIPKSTNVNLHMGDFLETIGDQVPTFSGIKFTSSDLVEGAEALRANNRRFAVFLGNDQLVSAGCSIGMDSFILTTLNLCPQYSLKIFESYKNNDMETANKTQEELSHIIRLILKHGNWVETMKYAMEFISPLDFRTVRPPLKQLSFESEVTMKTDLHKFIKRF